MTRIVTALMAVILGTASGAVVLAGDLSKFYDARLSEKVERCAGKSCFLGSRSGCLRKYAKINQEKAAFLKASKPDLVRQMIELDVGTKPYKIDYFLISAFGDFQERSQVGLSE